MRVIVRCRGNNRFRVSVVNTETGERTGWDAPSFFSLSLLLALIARAYADARFELSNCANDEEKVKKLLERLGVVSELNRREENASL